MIVSPQHLHDDIKGLAQNHNKRWNYSSEISGMRQPRELLIQKIIMQKSYTNFRRTSLPYIIEWIAYTNTTQIRLKLYVCMSQILRIMR